MSSSDNRLPAVDTLRAVASQLIVLHHLAFYGPMSDIAQDLAPDLIGWLSEYARLAVQIFLVLGGFFAAKALAPEGRLVVERPVAALSKRYLRLVLPFAAALLIAIAGAFIARTWMQHDSIPAAPMVRQVAAHILLLHGVLDYDSLSAGAWYVAIDFQLFALMLALLWLGQRMGGPLKAARWPVVVMAAGSLLWFNRNPDLDNIAPYFFGAYGLGAVAWWASCQEKARGRFVVMVALCAVALAIDFRSRIALALATACLLVLTQRARHMPEWMSSQPIKFLSRVSYSVFLVHFPICLVVNAIFNTFMPDDAWVQAGGMVLAWVASVGFGALFYRWIEMPAQVWASRVSEAVRAGLAFLAR